MVDITKDFDPTTFDTSNYELDASLPKEKNKKVICLMKHELGGKIIKKKCPGFWGKNTLLNLIKQ